MLPRMLIDEVAIRVHAGHGGKGAVAWSKILRTLGPTGARGGNGGSIYLEAIADLGALRTFRARKVFAAKDGEDGRPSFRDGQAGEDLILKVPRGTVVHEEGKNETHELTKLGERYLLVQGGRGGKGNYHFRSPTNTSPTEFQPGLPGEEKLIRLELKLIADVGLIGLPNVGKSSFLNAVTNATSKVANYQFTTLEPHLGAYYGLILADIPGLIEGASEGRGLGIKFLRHIERTRILFHFIDLASEHPEEDYDTIRGELGAYNPALLEKQEYIVLSKADTVDEERINAYLKRMRKKNPNTIVLSVEEKERLDDARKILNQIAQETIVTAPEGSRDT